MDTLYKEFKRFGTVKNNVSLSNLTTFQVGGPARYLISVKNTDLLIGLLNFLKENDEKYLLLGSGSNILFPDSGYSGIIIKICTDKITCTETENIITADGGVLLGQVLNTAVKNSLSGLEWATGIPGTVGAAVRGNAGAMGQDTAKNIAKVIAYRDKEVVELSNAECKFAYRGSIFKHNNDVILQARFKTAPGETEQIKKQMKQYLQLRTNKFPPYPSAGSFFKNIKIEKWPGDATTLPPLFLERGSIPVGWIMEQVAMKGFVVGGAMVSKEHGNFIINYKNATQKDILQIVEEAKNRVYNKFGIELEPEVEIIKP